MNRSRAALTLSLLLGWPFVGSYAATVSYTGSFEIIGTPMIPVVDAGDIFHFAFDLNDSATDSSVSFGNFDGAVTNLTLNRDPANSSSWDPSLLTLNEPDFLTNDDYSTVGTIFEPDNTIMDTWMVYVDGSFSMRVYGADTDLSLLNDGGTGQTLAQISGGAFDPTLFTTDQGATLAISGYSIDVRLITFMPVPLPAAVWLFGTALGFIASIRRITP